MSLRIARHQFHIIPPVEWPFFVAFSLPILLLGLILSFASDKEAYQVCVLGIILLSLSVFFWFYDVVLNHC